MVVYEKGQQGTLTKHEEKRKVVRVPEGLEALVPNVLVCGGIPARHGGVK